MTGIRKIGAAAVVAAMALITPMVNGQAATQFIGVGSSALWQTTGIAAWELTGKAHHYTFKLNATTNGVPTDGVSDARTTGIADAQGSLWIVWDSSTAPTKVYAGVSLDSTVGDRLVFGTTTSGVSTGQLVLPSTIPAAGNLITVTWGADDATLPAAVVNDLKAAPRVTAAFTDIRPEDAAFATARAFATLGASVQDGTDTTQNIVHDYAGLGYNGALSTTLTKTNWIESSYSSTGFQVVKFNVHGTDPYTGHSLPSSFFASRVGFSPVIVVANRSNTSGLGKLNTSGNYYFTNLSPVELSQMWSAGLAHVCDTAVFHVTGAPTVPLTVVRREPLSGTYNTFEFQGVNVPYNATLADQTSQEDSVNPNDNTTGQVGNPLNLNCDNNSADGNEKRAIGTGEMVGTAVFGTSDSLGYTFFSFGNVSKIAGSKSYGYLTVDGVDPLHPSYGTGSTAGELPTTGTLANLFTHVKDGTYPIWSDLRIITTTTANETLANALAARIQTDINNGTQLPDFLPYSTSLVLYRSHYANPETTGAVSNGLSGAAENGGDVNGVIYTSGNVTGDLN